MYAKRFQTRVIRIGGVLFCFVFYKVTTAYIGTLNFSFPTEDTNIISYTRTARNRLNVFSFIYRRIHVITLFGFYIVWYDQSRIRIFDFCSNRSVLYTHKYVQRRRTISCLVTKQLVWEPRSTAHLLRNTQLILSLIFPITRFQVRSASIRCSRGKKWKCPTLYGVSIFASTRARVIEFLFECNIHIYWICRKQW